MSTSFALAREKSRFSEGHGGRRDACPTLDCIALAKRKKIDAEPGADPRAAIVASERIEDIVEAKRYWIYRKLAAGRDLKDEFSDARRPIQTRGQGWVTGGVSLRGENPLPRSGRSC